MSNANVPNCPKCGSDVNVRSGFVICSEEDLSCDYGVSVLVTLGDHLAFASDPAPVDMVNSPPHYKGANGLEVIDVIEAFGLDKSFRIANAVKYLLRADKKGHRAEDIAKAVWYLNRELSRTEKTES